MALKDWSRGKITLVMLGCAAPIAVIMIVTAPSDKAPSADCQRVDQIAHHLVTAGALPGGDGVADPDITRKAAEAATAAREEAASIEDPDLKRKALAFADALHQFSQGNPSAPPNGWPDKNYMGGYQNSFSTLYELKVACPNVGTDPMPADMPTMPAG
ncbi:hypothetical protein [Mycolicibacterium lutetiense]